MLHQKLLLLSMSKKKYNDFFILRSHCCVFYNNEYELQSNDIVVISPIRKRKKMDYGCSAPYWRY